MLYRSASEVGAAFLPIAVLNYTEEARLVNEPILWNAVRRKATKMGASGVILPAKSRVSTFPVRPTMLLVK
jgi:hypothetical protein